MANWDEASKEGRIIPRPGVDSGVDAANERLSQANEDLASCLIDAKRVVAPSVCFCALGSTSHLFEVPENKCNAVPRDWELVGTRKGYRRYLSPELKDAMSARDQAEEDRQTALSQTLSVIMDKFASYEIEWRRATSAAATFDALCSLAVFAHAQPQMVRPVVRHTPPPTASASTSASDSTSLAPSPHFIATGLVPPTAIKTQNGQPFVPNDLTLTESAGRMALLSGPNMGGKSTSLRTLCLTALLAQVGSWVPATSCYLSPCDAFFVRMGARDRIMAGQSTFYVEMSETASILRTATPHSLVALDELGRGTSTFDGAAIATAVFRHLVDHIKCRGVFATHYHALAEEYASSSSAAAAAAVTPVVAGEKAATVRNSNGVQVVHMGCRVRDDHESSTTKTTTSGGGSASSRVVFLYKMMPGACPRSYGAHAARLAGLPTVIVNRAAAVASMAEAQGLVHAAQMSARRGTTLEEDEEAGRRDLEKSGLVRAIRAVMKYSKAPGGDEEGLGPLRREWHEAGLALAGGA
jgi:DNA mismatch repair protein MSH6